MRVYRVGTVQLSSNASLVHTTLIHVALVVLFRSKAAIKAEPDESWVWCALKQGSDGANAEINPKMVCCRPMPVTSCMRLHGW